MSSHSRSDWRPSDGLALDAPIPAAAAFTAAAIAVHLASGAAWWSRHHDLFAAFLGSRPVRQRIEAGGQFAPLIAAGQAWRLWTCVLVHADGLHLAVNCLSLWALGRILEPVLGPWRWASWAWAGGVGGAVCAHLAGHLQSDGASGAGFSLLGAGVVLGFRHRWSLPPADARLLGPVLAGFLAVNLLLSAVLPSVDAIGHLGGLAVGVVLAVAIDVRRTRALDAIDAGWVLACCAVCGWGWYSA